MSDIPHLSSVERERLKAIVLEPSQIVGSGKVIFCCGREIVRIGDLHNIGLVPQRANIALLSQADYLAVTEALK